ncbi:MAG TPA: PP2C family protein-serine/threonine phosphatase [Acidobacteriaceae bacterium]|nr:PP2C family protein-serine/threonine phosphatase [Acidobacteriaceae bacterium]
MGAPAPIVHITLGQSAVALTGPWKFHVGDDPEWAGPAFDDSQWETVDLARKSGAPVAQSPLADTVPGWTARGRAGTWGYAWYRIRVQVTARPGDRTALVGPPAVNDAYQLFVDGHLLGGSGTFRGGDRWPVTYSAGLPETFLLSPPTVHGDASAPQVLALRVWMSPHTMETAPGAGGLRSLLLVGEPGAIREHARLVSFEIVRENAWHIGECLLFVFLAIIAGSLIYFDRSDPVYRWLTLAFLLIAIANTYEPLCWLHLQSDRTGHLLESVFLNPGIFAVWTMVWWVWFQLRRPLWAPKMVAALTVLSALSELLRGRFLHHSLPPSVIDASLVASVGFRVLILLLLILIVVLGIRQQGREGWLTVPAILLLGIGFFQGQTGVLHIPSEYFPFGVRFSLHQIGDLALIAVLGVLILRRLILSLRRQRELALDVNQAQEVQRVLIPEDLPQVPGWIIESEYRPASEVGGDFFQIIPLTPVGNVLVVMGDVTGKGLQAGMLVALIVGALRTAAEADPDPLHVLGALNRRLFGRGHAHATCLALRVEADGSATLANAGHLPPCVNGKELAMEGSVPLGIVDDADFPITRFHLGAGDRLTLMSDGIAEAQDEQGHLFGFERMQAISGQSARIIAETAQKFGQQDDISVLSVVRAVVG